MGLDSIPGSGGQSGSSGQKGHGSPVGLVVPSAVGGQYTDLDAGSLYIATGLTNADWHAVGGGSSGPPDQLYRRHPLARQQVLMDGSVAVMAGLIVDVGAPGVGTGITYDDPNITFHGDGVRTVTAWVFGTPGTDGGVPASGSFLFASSGNFEDPELNFVIGNSAPGPEGIFTMRRFFSDGETLEPDVQIAGNDVTKHAAVGLNIWVVGG